MVLRNSFKEQNAVRRKISVANNELITLPLVLKKLYSYLPCVNKNLYFNNLEKNVCVK